VLAAPVLFGGERRGVRYQRITGHDLARRQYWPQLGPLDYVGNLVPRNGVTMTVPR
jgi:hypothetical protein